MRTMSRSPAQPDTSLSRGQPTQYDLYITITSASTDDAIAKAGDYGWDIEALFSGGKIRPVISGELTLKRSMIAHASP